MEIIKKNRKIKKRMVTKARVVSVNTSMDKMPTGESRRGRGSIPGHNKQTVLRQHSLNAGIYPHFPAINHQGEVFKKRCFSFFSKYGNLRTKKLLFTDVLPLSLILLERGGVGLCIDPETPNGNWREYCTDWRVETVVRMFTHSSVRLFPMYGM